MINLDNITTTDSNPLLQEKWYKEGFLPALGFLYIAVCSFDFIVGPALSMFIMPILGKPFIAWIPLTLQNGGIIHLAFGAILGIYAYKKT